MTTPQPDIHDFEDLQKQIVAIYEYLKVEPVTIATPSGNRYTLIEDAEAQ